MVTLHMEKSPPTSKNFDPLQKIMNARKKIPTHEVNVLIHEKENFTHEGTNPHNMRPMKTH